MHNAHLPSRRGRQVWIVVPPFSAADHPTVDDPKPSAGALQCGHSNRMKLPFSLRQRGVPTFSIWMPTRGGDDRARPRPAAVRGHRHRARPRRRSTAPARPGLRVRPAHQLVTTVAAHPCATPGRLVPAPAGPRARGRLGVGARAQVRRQARETAHRRQKPTFDPHHRPDHNQARAFEMAIPTATAASWSSGRPSVIGSTKSPRTSRSAGS